MRTADAELFKEKIEVTLDGRQIFYLFFGGAVIASLVFVLGVVVGRRVEAQSHMASVSAAATDPLSALDQLEAAKPGRLSFSSTLSGNAAGKQPLGAVDKAVAANAADLGAKGAKGSAPAKEAASGAAKSANSAKAAQPAKATGTDSSQSAAESASAAPSDSDQADGAGKAPASAAATKPSPKANAKSSPAAKAKFTLQLSSFQDRAEAESFYGELQKSGYEPYIIEAQVPQKGVYYRVRLGRYPSYEDAIAAKKKFEGRMHIIAYVTRL